MGPRGIETELAPHLDEALLTRSPPLTIIFTINWTSSSPQARCVRCVGGEEEEEEEWAPYGGSGMDDRARGTSPPSPAPQVTIVLNFRLKQADSE